MAVAILLLQGQKWPYVDESLELEGDALRVDFDSVFQAVKKKVINSTPYVSETAETERQCSNMILNSCLSFTIWQSFVSLHVEKLDTKVTAPWYNLHIWSALPSSNWKLLVKAAMPWSVPCFIVYFRGDHNLQTELHAAWEEDFMIKTINSWGTCLLR